VSRGPAPAPGSQGYRRADRILSRTDFLRVQREGKRVHTPHFVIMVLPAETQRLGITITRRAAGAVGRNRVKRLVREVYRRERVLFPPAAELVLVARTGADRLDYATVRDEVSKVKGALLRAAREPIHRPDPSETRS
jgi:ribonuclease P protein component